MSLGKTLNPKLTKKFDLKKMIVATYYFNITVVLLLGILNLTIL